MVILNATDVTSIKNTAEAFIKNTNLYSKDFKDPFWNDAADVLVCACVGILCEKPEGSNIPYAKIDEIIGGESAPHYESCFGNVENLLRLATITYNPQSSPIRIMDGAVVKENASELDVIFANLKAYELKTASDMKKPYCLWAWETFQIGSTKTIEKLLEVISGSAFKPVWVPEKVVKAPDAITMSDENFKQSLYTQDNEDAKNVAIDGYKKLSFEDATVPESFN